MAEIVATYNNTEDVWSESRYRFLRIHRDSGGNLFYESPDELIVLDPESLYTTLDKVTEHRLDLVAYRSYGRPGLWWVIAAASGIENPLDTLMEREIVIPSRVGIYGTGGLLSA